MPIVEDRMLGGLGQSAQNLLVGDTSGALAALNKPEELSPKERDAFLKKYGVDKHPFAAALRLITNPVVILTAITSMKFPVPTAANIFKFSEEVSGYTAKFPLLRGLASMQSWFRGTPVVDIFDNIVHDTANFKSKWSGELGTALRAFRQSQGRDVNNMEQKLIALWLDGAHKVAPGVSKKPLAPALEAYMTPQTMTLAKRMRDVLDGIWEETFGNLDSRRKIMAALTRAQKAGFSDDITKDIMAWAESGQKMPDYFPRRLMASEDEFLKFLSAVTGTGASAGKMSDFAKRSVERMRRVVGPEAHMREGLMMPSLKELREVEHVLDPEVYATMKDRYRETILKRATEVLGKGPASRLSELPFEQMSDALSASKVLDPEDAQKFSMMLKTSGPRQYSITAFPVLNKYIHTMGTTYGWSARGGGEKMFDEITQMRLLSHDARAKQRLAMLENTYIPMALGWGDFKQALKSQKWHQDMMRLAVTLDTPTIRSLMGPALHDRMTEMLIQDRSAASLINLQRRGAGWFYLSTLGGNPAAALKNLLQPVLTTGPVVGYRSMAEGMFQAFKKSEKYYRGRLGQGLSHDEAIRAAFPEYASTGLAGTPLVDEALANTLANSYEVSARLPGGVHAVGEKIARAMMSLFGTSEQAVRLGTFEAGMLHARRTGLVGADALKFSKKLVEATQFLTGPQNTPYALLGLPPMMRQLAQFPLRMAEFATSTAFRIGSGEKNIFGLNPGTFSRALLGSVVAYELGNAVGVDASDALFTGALPGMANEGRAFAPFPLVPPAFQILGAAATGLGTGEWEQLQRALPLLMPGGVGLSKAVGAIPGGEDVAAFLGRPYADYESPSPSGRIAIYTPNGQLKGFYSPWDVFAMSVGIKTGDRVREEQLMQTVIANRDDIRQQKASFLDAVMRNDPGKAEGIGRNFKTRYGFGIPVSKNDIGNAQIRRATPRLISALQTMPRGPLRDQYAQLIQMSLGAGADSILGMPAEALTVPKAARTAATQRIGGAGRNQPPQITATGGVIPGQLSHVTYDVDDLSPL